MIALKYAHVTLALLSAGGFVLRAGWMLVGSPLLRRPVVRIVPHVVDTLLLLSGLTLAWTWGVGPTTHPWFAAKLGALAAYIVLGSLALGRARTRGGRLLALAGALAALGWIFGTALTHRPTVF